MPVFEFDVTGGRNFGGTSINNVTGVLTGTIDGQAFTFSYSAADARGFDEIILGGNYLVLATTVTTSGGIVQTSSSIRTAFNGTFAFTDPSLFFDDFQLNANGGGFSELEVITTMSPAAVNVGFGANFMGNVVSFTVSGYGSGSNVLNSITSDAIQCFCAGTRIATPCGAARVEELAEGDLVTTADGRAVPVRWVGMREVDPRLTVPARVNPVRIAAGAMGNARDLLLSPDHAVLVDGCLVHAGALLDGDQVRQVRRTAPFTYYHVETDAHELILAEGIACESYLPARQELAFDNEASRPARQIAEMDLPRVTSKRLRPAKHAA